MKNSKPVNIPTTTACTAKNLSGKTTLFQATAKRFARVAFAVLSLGLLATACKSNNPQPEPAEANAAKVTSALSTSSLPATATSWSSGAMVTRSVTPLTDPEDQRVHSLWVLQFDKVSGNRVGLPFYTPVSVAQQSGNLISNLSLYLTATSNTQILCFVGNVGETIFEDDTKNLTYSAFISNTITLTGEYQPSADAGLPMFGTLEIPSLTSGMTLPQVALDRLVAKVQLKYKNSFPDFTVTSIQVRNVAKNIVIAPANTGAVNYPAKTADSHFDYAIEAPVAAGGDGYSVINWYMPENLRKPAVVNPTLAMGDRTLANTDDQMATYIEVIGKLTNGVRDELVVYTFLLGDLNSTNGQSDFNLKRNYSYTLSFDIVGSNISDHRIVAAPITTIAPAQTANAYMVAPGAGIILPAKIKGNEATNTLATQSMALLWQDVPELVRYISYSSDGKALVVTNDNKGSGNALVAAYDGPNGTGNILWSWHIWVTGYKPSEAGVAVRTTNTTYTVTGGQVHTYGAQFQTTNGTSRTIMDRDLGANMGYNTTVPVSATDAAGTYGLSYQWGRKDPFPSATVVLGSTTSIPLYNFAGTAIPAASAPAAATGPVSPATSILNPTTIYTTTSAPGDWASLQDDNLWAPTTKALYDPCPKGWKVAPSGTWSDFTRTSATVGTFLWYTSGIQNESSDGAQNGRRYSAGTVNAWYPASGYRTFSSVPFANTGLGGYRYTSSVSGVYAVYSYFTKTGLALPANACRGTSLSVRCVQE